MGKRHQIRDVRERSLLVLPGTFAISRLNKEYPIPDWAMAGSFLSVTRTKEEVSIVCSEKNVPDGIRCEKSWRCLKVKGPLDFSMTGIIASITEIVAAAGISIFAVSTYDTDYFLLKEENLQAAISELAKEGFEVRPENNSDILP